jgi:beta-glucosidase
MALRKFPDGFLWGCATAAHQVEGGNHGNDWWDWELQGRIRTGESSDPSCDHYHRYRQDFEILRQLNNNAHRLSIEWSRVEPEPGRFDASQLAHYGEVLSELRHRGMAPMVTLHHFTSPRWFVEQGGWAASGAPRAWLPFVRRVAEELGSLVELWCTINEPNLYAQHGWMLGTFPPGRRNDLLSLYRVLANLRRAHLAAYRELQRLTPAVPIGLAHNKWLMLPAGERRSDRWAARIAATSVDCWPAGTRLEKVLETQADYIGINHYSASAVSFALRGPREYLVARKLPPGVPVSDYGWAVYAGWMRAALLEAGSYRRPVYITENGIATKDDALRRDYLSRVLGEVWQAIQEGVDVRGYFHWTSVDNFEWDRGYSIWSGLIGLDRQTQERTVKPSGRWFGEVAGANGLPDLPS